MTNDAQARTTLAELSKSVLHIHRALLQYQKELHEFRENKALTPYEVLDLSLSHPEFEWLRVLSQLIVEIDERTDDKEQPIGTFDRDAVKKMRDVFVDTEQFVDFKKRLRTAIGNDVQLGSQIVALIKKLNSISSENAH